MQREMKCIILIGYMCAGKTTVGKRLAKALGRTFYDLDWYVEERYHKRVSDIFATEGEAAFRDMERRMLHEVAEFQDVVLACGGGTPCFFDNMTYMNSVADTIYMKASVSTLMQHLSVSRGDRPLLNGKTDDELRQFITRQLAERAPYYEQARYVQNIDVLSSFQEVETVVQQLRERLGL